MFKLIDSFYIFLFYLIIQSKHILNLYSLFFYYIAILYYYIFTINYIFIFPYFIDRSLNGYTNSF